METDEGLITLEPTPIEKIAEPVKPKSFLETLIADYEEPKYIITSMGHMYKGSFKFIRINKCNDCKHCTIAQEDGAQFMVIDSDDSPEEEQMWYFCRHERYKDWPRKIGQLKEVTEKVAFFCPLDDIVPEKAEVNISRGQPDPQSPVDASIVTLNTVANFNGRRSGI